MAQKQEHAFIKIGKDIKAGKIPGLVLLKGVESYLVDFYSRTLISKYVNKASEVLDLVVLDRKASTAESIIDNLETLPLMSERKVVLLPDFIDERGKLPEAFQDEKQLKNLIDYMEESLSGRGEDSGRLLLITAAEPRSNKKESAGDKAAAALLKAAAKAGAVYDFTPLNSGQLRSFVEKRFRAAGKEFRPGIISMIVEETGYGNKNIDYGLYNIDNDIRKIIAHSGRSTEISPTDVASVITVNPENNVFAMIDAIGRNRKDEAFRLLHNLLENGSSEFQLLALITGQLELMLTTCEMKDEGMNLKGIQAELRKNDRIHEFRTQKALEAGNRFRIEDLRRILIGAYDIERNIKSGLMPGPLALEFFIAGI
ncbi:MAG: DNA polymerase III subunit delta [Lentihominibacter sp.]